MSFKTAAEMREITQESIMSDVEKEMEARAKQGKYEYAFDGLLTTMQKEKLIELGYNVRTGYQYNEPWAIISW